jgi:hypothetical protein
MENFLKNEGKLLSHTDEERIAIVDFRLVIL